LITETRKEASYSFASFSQTKFFKTSMALSFRKSFGNSLFRVNISKSGLSYSTGIKGARINTGPRGTYVTFSAYGIQYRKKIAPSTVSPTSSPQVQLPPSITGYIQ